MTITLRWLRNTNRFLAFSSDILSSLYSKFRIVVRSAILDANMSFFIYVSNISTFIEFKTFKIYNSHFLFFFSKSKDLSMDVFVHYVSISSFSWVNIIVSRAWKLSRNALFLFLNDGFRTHYVKPIVLLCHYENI